jgi:drug/metabolite transporter (DMT)-like permease
MVKFFIILLLGLACESAGVVLLKKGMGRVGEVKEIRAAEIFRVVKAGVTNKQILLGVLFEALFFVTLLILMSKNDVSLVWPLTSLSFVFATFAAMWFLAEKVSGLRWGGVVLIMMGAALITYSEQRKRGEESSGPESKGTLQRISP